MNLSRKGIAFKSLGRLKKGEVYQLGIKKDPSEENISCQARIQWVTAGPEADACICGASIVQMDPAQKTDLLDALYQDWKQKILIL